MTVSEAARTLLGGAAAAGRVACAIPQLLSRPIDATEARLALARRLSERESRFLQVVRQGVYQHPPSPYQALLRQAGCEWGDLEALVRQDGVEGALTTLFHHGVYLTVDEFKGRRPIVRGSTTVAVKTSMLRNPAAAAHVPLQSGGSRGVRTDLWLDARFVRERAGNIGLVFHSRGPGIWEFGIWLVPGGAVIVHILEFALFGTPQRRWFSQLDPASPALPARYRWSHRLVRAAALMAGVRLPGLRYVSLDDPLPIARWMAEAIDAGRRPNLWTFASSAVRLCRAAADTGMDLQGAMFSVGGEPFTEARQAAIRRVGAEAYPQYGIAECGEVAGACLAPHHLDEMHLFHDLHAVIQPETVDPVSGLTEDTLLISSLSPAAPFVLLNVSMGDRATLQRRPCGCPIERLGWTTHLHSLRSDEKLTAAGMTFHDTEVVRVLEDHLPARFGGGPTDYQLLEEEDAEGRPRLRLLVHPRVAGFDGTAIAEAFLAGLDTGLGAERLMALLWREAGVLTVERRAPVTAVSGKLLHLHSSRSPSRAGTGATA